MRSFSTRRTQRSIPASPTPPAGVTRVHRRTGRPALPIRIRCSTIPRQRCDCYSSKLQLFRPSMQRIFSTLGLAFGVAGCEASPSSTANTETDRGVIVADTDACDLGEYACPIGFPCTSVRIGDGSCVDLPEGEGLRLYGDPACVLGMLRDGTTGNFFVDVCPATSPPFTDYVT